MARKIAPSDRDSVVAAVRRVMVEDRSETVKLEGGGSVRVTSLTGTMAAIMPNGRSGYTRTRHGASRETLGVCVRVTRDGELQDPDQVASHVDVVIRRAIAAVESYAAVAA